MMNEFEISDEIPASPEEVYSSWLSSEGHTRMTGAAAESGDQVGSSFQAWGGYISGSNLELVPNQKIVLSWRTADFTAEEEDSRVEIELSPTASGGCLVRIRHSNLPPHGIKYKEGWVNHYFNPMKKAFAGEA
jgi:uncharacterized protein YndB with AHSA1/START domain